MRLLKNTKLGKINLFINFLFVFVCLTFNAISSDKNENIKRHTEIKILDKISSKNISLKLTNGENFEYSDLLIKSIKCKHSEFDDDPEIIAYVQVRDLSNKKK